MIALNRVYTLSIAVLLLLGFLAVIQVKPAYGTTLFSDGFESGNLNAWTGTGGSPTATTDQHHQGSYGCAILNNGNYAYKDLGAGYVDCYIRVYAYFTALPRNYLYRITVSQLIPTDNTYYYCELAIQGNSSGVNVMCVRDAWGGMAYGTTVIQLNQWYCLELRRHEGDGVYGYLNGVQECYCRGAWVFDTTRAQIGGANQLSSKEYIDDVVVDSSYIGPSSPSSLQFSNIGTSTVLPGQSCQFSCLISGSNVSSYIFSTNNTGTWTNDTAIASGQPSVWANVTKTLTSTVGAVVGYEWYANDTSGNWGASGVMILTTRADTTPPTFGSISANTTVAGAAVNLSCTVSDNVAVSSYTCSWNNTGSWVNQTAVSVSSSSATATLTGTWNSTSGNTVSAKVYANDTSNNWNTSPQYNFTVTAASASKLVFTAGANQSLPAGQLSTAITVQRQDQYGNPFTSGSVTVNLASTSLGATFYSDAGNTPASSVTISDGFSTVNFWYNDTAVGAPTLTVSTSGLTSANTTFVITSPLIFSDGFESGNGSAWNKGSVISGGIQSFVNSPVYQGNWAMENQMTSPGLTWCVVYAEYDGHPTLYMRAYVQFTTLPIAGQDTVMVQIECAPAGAGCVAGLGLGYSGGAPKWMLYYMKNGANSYSALYAGTPTTNAWHCLEVMATVDAANGAVKAYVDGSLLMSDSGFENNYHGQGVYTTLGLDTWDSANYVNTGYFDDAVVSTQYIGPEVSPTRALTIFTAGSGSVNLNNTGPYYDGDVVKLTAIPVTGWSFQSWSGNLTGSANPAVLTIMGNMSVTATFTQNNYTVSVTVLPSSAAGTVTPNATGPYHYGDTVVLTESSNAGYTFSGWSGAGSGAGSTRTVTVTGNMSVTATFIQNVYTLTVTPSGSGSVTLNNTGPYHYGDVVQLTAVPTIGWSFANWTGDLTGSTSPATVTVTGDMTVTATFTQNVYTLTTLVVGSGNVISNGTGTLHYNDIVTLIAQASIGWTFNHWSGNVTGSTNPTTLTITGNMNVIATFLQDQYTLAMIIVGSGTVDESPLQATYTYGTLVTLETNPTAGWSFANWTGDVSGTANPTTINMTGNKSVTATFTENVYTITVNVIGQGSIRVSPSGPGYNYNDTVTLTPSASSGWSFAYWSGDLSGSANPATIAMTGNFSITATFTQNAYSPFSIVTNSTVTQLAFDSASKELSFTVSGPSGTYGFANVTIAKTLISDISNLAVYLNGTQISYTTYDLINYWSIYFTYHHSTHRVVIDFASQQTKILNTPWNAVAVATVGLAIAISATLAITAKRKRRFSNFNKRKTLIRLIKSRF